MREIKFRAWGIFSGKNQMQEVMPVKQLPSGQWELWWMGSIFTMNNLMQYTGIKDKNGVGIYEGDVVMCPGCDDDYKYSAITYDDGSFILESHFKRSMQRWLVSHFELEVIGNIYENPELIK